jgi:hypothetical protein
MKRKTVRVTDVVDTVNRILDVSTCSVDTRWGMIAILEQILHDSGNYKGYNNVKDGKICGYKEQPDDTRRYYYGGTK